MRFVPEEPQPLAGNSTPSKNPVRSYPTAIVEDVQLTEKVDVTAADYEPQALGSAYPDTSKYPDHVLVNQVPQDWKYITRIYSKLPGPYSYEDKTDDDGAPMEVSRRTVENTGQLAEEALSGGVYSKLEYEPIQGNDFLRTEITSSRAIPGPVRANSQVGEWGVEPVVKQRVALTATVDTGFLVKTSEIQSINDLIGEKVTVSYPAALADLTVVGSEIDPETGIVVKILKKFVAAGTYGGIQTVGGIAYYAEVQPHDIYRSIWIGSAVVAVPSPQSLGWSMGFPLPPVLNAINVLNSVADGEGTASGTSSDFSISHSWDADVYLSMSHAVISDFKGTRLRTFYLPSAQPTEGDIPACTKIQPGLGTVVVTGGSVSRKVAFSTDGSSATNINTDAKAHVVSIPPCLYGASGTVNITGSSTAFAQTSSIKATLPTTAPAGSWTSPFVARVTVQLVRFGVVIIDKYTLTIP